MSGAQIRLKYVASLNPETLPEDTPGETEIKYIDIGSVGRGHLVEKPQVLLFEEAPSRARRIVRTGDTIVSSVRTYLRAVLPIDQDLSGAIASTGFVVVRPTDANARFVAWSLQSTRFVDEVVARSVGVSYPAIAPTEFGTIEVRVPPLPTQRKIAGFLDRETERIDALVDKKRRLIDLLEEKRTATITQAVTRGLNPTAPMKPSGIPWIGRIPEHWRRLPTRHGVSRITSGSRGWARYYADVGVPFIRISNVARDGIDLDLSDLRFVDPPDSAETQRTRIEDGDLVVSITADIGSVGVIDDARVIPSYPSQHLALMSPLPFVHHRWLAYALKGASAQAQLDCARYGGTKTQLALEDVLDVDLPWPPAHEQQQIASWIDAMDSTLVATVTIARTQLSLLAEYREALITAAVTGEIDVDTFDNDPHMEEATA